MIVSKLRQKSDFNIDAADILITKDLYAPSVHCSYYSCFQLLKYTINVFFGIDYKKLKEDIACSNPHKGTHQYVINFIYKELSSLTNIKESQNFRRKINDLKQFRIESDYEEIEVLSDQGKKAYELAKMIRTYIIKNFNV